MRSSVSGATTLLLSVRLRARVFASGRVVRSDCVRLRRCDCVPSGLNSLRPQTSAVIEPKKSGSSRCSTRSESESRSTTPTQRYLSRRLAMACDSRSASGTVAAHGARVPHRKSSETVPPKASADTCSRHRSMSS